MYKLFLSFRYLRTRTIAYLSVGVIAVGVAILLIVSSVMGGFSRQIQSLVRGTTSHISIRGAHPLHLFAGYQELVERVEKLENVVGVAPHLEWPVLPTKIMDLAYIVGIESEREARATDYASYVLPPANVHFDRENRDNPEPQDKPRKKSRRRPIPCLIGAEVFGLYRKGDLWPWNGMTFQVMTVPPDMTNPLVPITGRLRVEGGFHTGMFEYDSRMIYVPLEEAQRFLNAKGKVTKLCVRLEDYGRVWQMRERIKNVVRETHPGLVVRVWEEERANLLKAVAMERFLNFIILFLLVAATSFNITAVLYMLVGEKTRDIGVLRAMGGTVRGIVSIFLLEGLSIGFLGALIGLVLGLVFLGNINAIAEGIEKLIGFHPFPKDIYYLDSIPTETNVWTIALICGLTLFASLLSSAWPAVKAGRLDPVETLRRE